MKILHNPRCMKSRQTLKLMRDKGHEPEIVKYLEHPPSKEELKDIINKLGISPHELIRTGESIYKEKFKDKDLSDTEWIEVMTTHPKLIERPIVIYKNRAVIGRPPENVLKLVD